MANRIVNRRKETNLSHRKIIFLKEAPIYFRMKQRSLHVGGRDSTQLYYVHYKTMYNLKTHSV